MTHSRRTHLGLERLMSLGVPVEYHSHAKHYADVMQGLGFSVSQIEAAIRFGAQFQGTEHELVTQFDLLCTQQGVAPELASLSESWLDQVNTRGFDNMPPVPRVPLTEAERSRLADIQKEMQKPRAESDYWRDPAVRDEYQTFLERMEFDKHVTAPSPRTNDVARKAELQEMMRDRASAYWREGTGLSAEYRAILERENNSNDTAVRGGVQSSSASANSGADENALQ